MAVLLPLVLLPGIIIQKPVFYQYLWLCHQQALSKEAYPLKINLKGRNETKLTQVLKQGARDSFKLKVKLHKELIWDTFL